MTRTTLLVRTILFHWRTNLAVWLGVVAGTAVIGGALIVGDSVRGSLRDMTLARLAGVDMALTGPRFFREQLVADLAPTTGPRLSLATAAILLPASLEKRSPGGASALTRAGRANAIGLDSNSWSLIVNGGNPQSIDETDLVLSSRLARDLEAAPGDEVTLLVELPSDIPRDALLGKRDQTAVEIPLTVRTILDEKSPGARFGLRPDQQLPLNAFVSLKTLQERLGLASRAPTQRDARSVPARVNTILRFHPEADGSGGKDPVEAARVLNLNLQKVWQLDDFHARLVINDKYDYISLESERMILDRPIAEAAREVAQRLGCRTSGVLAYIANEISLAGHAADGERPPSKPAYSRYSVVAGLDPEVLAADARPPFGPFSFQEPKDSPRLGEGDIEQADGIGEIVINDWLADDLGAKVGDVARLTYFAVGSHGELPEEERRFKVRGIVALEGTVAADRGLIPEVHGITDVNSFDDWDAPFPMKKVTKRDDAYWSKYRATPKAFVTLKTAQHLWQSRYGDLTSLRVAPIEGKSLADSKKLMSEDLLKQLSPAEMGLSFQPVRYQGLQAAS
ncbi:MAG TPA: hypothetical protein VKU82_04495, partial [Planctomycetaceae bacterium]|nr:hypothetical protein [Planctomycetaceae bacterium]